MAPFSNIEPFPFALALFIAVAGVWWFRLILPESKRWRPAVRNGIYFALAAAYFFLSYKLFVGMGV